jgi:hypothetical protein
MIIDTLGSRRQRKAVASVLATVIMLGLVFASGVGFLVYVSQNSTIQNQANAGRQAALQQASLERLALSVKVSSVADFPWGQTGDLVLRVNNTGGATATIVDVYVTNPANGQLVSNCKVVPPCSAAPPFTHYLNTQGSLAQKGDLNITLPLSITMGATTRTMTGCISLKTGCDIAISKTSYTYSAGTTVLVSVLTSAGNVFSAQYPTPASSTSGVQSSSLLVQLTASPPQTLSCSNCVTVVVTAYNYATTAIFGAALSPLTGPTAGVTGTASITNGGPPVCSSPSPSSMIPPYSGSTPGSITFTCTYNAATGAVGGFASFTGAATGTLNGAAIASAPAVSNTIQIGGTVNVLNQGPFTANAFFFKDSYCHQGSGRFYTSPCSQTPTPLDIPHLPNANPQDGSADYYVAYYVQVTNNLDTPLALLQYSYFQTDPTLGGESNFYLVGPASTYSAASCTQPSPTGCYFPDYTKPTPTLQAYGGDAVTCADGPAPTYNPPSPANCIIIGAGQTITLTFAACRLGSSDWNWGDSQYGRAFDNPIGCSPQAPPNYQTPESTYLSIILSFMYKGQVVDQQIPFQGETIFGGAGGLQSCNIGSFCGNVFYTQYTGTVGYFDFVYTPSINKFSIPNKPVVINDNLPHGSDGVVFNPQDHKILTGTNAPYNGFNEVDPNTGVATTYPATVPSYNLMVDSTGTTLWTDGDACPGCNSISYVSLVGGIGAPATLTLSGDDVNLNTIIFVDPTHVYYMAELGPRFQGQTGHVGMLNTATGVTTCFKSGGLCTVFNGVHGGVYDPFTKDLIVFGWNQINQINPITGALVASETVAALNTGNGNFDQGAVDGFGHLFISWAANNGDIYFEDYSGGTIGAGNFNVITNGGPNTCSGVCGGFASANAFNNVDDLAPIVGPGSQG